MDAYVQLVHRLARKNRLPVNGAAAAAGRLAGLQKVIDDFCENQLSEQQFPSVASEPAVPTPSKLLLFVVGGVSFNELHLPPAGKPVIIASDSLIYPKLFFDMVVGT